MSNKNYMLDSNFFINFCQDLLPPDIYPAFWQRLQMHYERGDWILLDCVKKELEAGTDFLVNWIKEPVFEAVETSDEQTIASYKVIMTKLQENTQYFDEAKQKYAASADSWIVACAHAHNAIIVTREVSKPKSQSSIKIPDIAQAHGVKTMNVNTFMRQPEILFKYDE